MLQLRRVTRFSINDADADLRSPNGFAGSPAIRGFGRHYEVEVACRGEPHASGYLIDIKQIDAAVRSAALPLLRAAAQRHEEPAAALPRVVSTLRDALGERFLAVRLALTPYHSLEMDHGGSFVLVRQRFDFAAAHRLHVPELSDAENRALFGKCNNESGHGHNYQLEPCIAFPAGGPPFPLAALEEAVDRTLIARFDHKHLNLDTPEFDSSRGGVNPTIENIARVCFLLLAPEIAKAHPGASLRTMTVWETDRTSAVYPG